MATADRYFITQQRVSLELRFMADPWQGLVLRKSTSEDCGFTTYAEIAQQVEQLTCKDIATLLGN